MNNSLHDYATIGLAHHLFDPTIVSDPALHADSLQRFMRRTDMDTCDLSVPWDPQLRRRVIPAIRDAGLRDVAYAIHLFPMRKVSLATTDRQEQDLVKMILTDQIAVAAAIGAEKFVFVSGFDPPPEQRPEAYDALRELSRWLCARLKAHDMTALLEQFDRTVDKKFLCGPSRECVDFIGSLGPETDNIGLLLDIAHVRLLGEPLAEAIRTCAPFLKRVHLGNCVLKDPSDPLYGDMHPPIGYEGGEIDVPELTEVLAALLEVGYLDPSTRRPLLVELRPLPGRTLDDWIADSLQRVHEAWARVVG